MIHTLALFFPAYVSSPLATLTALLPRRHPIDFGARLRDGGRIFGDGKTWEGLIIGTLFGGLLGLPVYVFFGVSANPFVFAFLGLLGDLIGSFVKRRMGLRRGEHAPILDELDFLFPPLVYAMPPWRDALVLILITPFLHRAVSILGYKLGVKREPW